MARTVNVSWVMVGTYDCPIKHELPAVKSRRIIHALLGTDNRIPHREIPVVVDDKDATMAAARDLVAFANQQEDANVAAHVVKSEAEEGGLRMARA